MSVVNLDHGRTSTTKRSFVMDKVGQIEALRAGLRGQVTSWLVGGGVRVDVWAAAFGRERAVAVATTKYY